MDIAGGDLAHVGPQNAAGAALRHDEPQRVAEPGLGGLARAEHKVAGHLAPVGRALLHRQLGVQSVDVLEVVVLQDAGLHGVVLLPPLGVLLHLLLVPLTLDPLTAGMMIIVAGQGSDT